MTAADFRAFLEVMDWSDKRASEELGLSRNTIARYQKVNPPEHIGYACAALAEGLDPWTAPRGKRRAAA